MLIPALSGHIYINLENRNLKGSVKQGGEYERILDELSSRFLELKGPDDEPLFVKAIRPVKLYGNEDIDYEITADLILIPNDGYTTSDKVNKKTSSMKLLPAEHVGGSHRYEGMYIFNGPNVRMGKGRPMQNIFRRPVDVKFRKTGEMTSKLTRTDEVLSSEQEEQIVRRLRALGYTE